VKNGCVVCVWQDFESNELEWEHREVELERTIVRLEKQQAEIASVASQVVIATLPLVFKVVELRGSLMCDDCIIKH